MYAIVSTGGKQYKVSKDDELAIEKIAAAQGDTIEFQVLFISDGDKIITDAGDLAKAKVTAEVIEQFRGTKQVVFKFKKRKGYKRLRGHRQDLTRVRILDILPSGSAAKRSTAKPKAAAEDTKSAKAESTTTAAKSATKAAPKQASASKTPAKKVAPKDPDAGKADKTANDEDK